MTSGVHYRLLIDWAATGSFAEALDDVSASVLGSPGIAVEYGRDTARSTAPPMIGGSTATLINEDRAFSPENPGSGRYLQIRPGRPYRVEAYTGTPTVYRDAVPYRKAQTYRGGTTTYPLFQGATARMAQSSDWGNRTVELTALSTMSMLQRTVISVAYLGDSRIDSVIQAILDAAGWPSDKRLLYIGDALVHGYWVDERTAWDCLVEAVTTEGAGSLLFQDTSGNLIFQNRNYRATAPRSMSSQYVLHDGVGTPPSGLGPILTYERLEYDPRWEDIVTRVTVPTHRRELASTLQVVWQGPGDIALGTQAQTIWARPSDPFQAMTAPVAGTDYTITGGTASVTLAWNNGAVARLDIVPLTGLGTLSGLQLRAYPLAKVGETTIESYVVPVTPSDAKTLEIRAWPMLEASHAKAIADSYVLRYKDLHATVDVTFRNIDAAHQSALFDMTMSDRVTIVNQHLGINGAYWVEKIRHTISGGGRHDLTISCEPVVAIGTIGDRWDEGLWDVAVWGY